MTSIHLFLINDVNFQINAQFSLRNATALHHASCIQHDASLVIFSSSNEGKKIRISGLENQILFKCSSNVPVRAVGEVISDYNKDNALKLCL